MAMAMSATKAMAMAKRSPKASGRIRGTARKTMVRTKAAGREERRVEKEASTVLWAQAWAPMLLLATESEAQYSKGSYYVTLALFLMSIPGLYSLVKRSTKSKVVRKVFEMPGPAAEGAKSLDEIARTVSNYFKNNNYKVVDAGETVTFEGKVKASVGTASYITFCTFMGLLSTGLVLSIWLPWGGNYWYLITLVSPYAGVYYLQNANRSEKVQVKLVTSDDDMVTDMVVQGGDEEVERMTKELQLMEKGMIYVKGLLES
eukprot:scaffold659_cov318-Pavlova_lutheri.AAC.10